MFPSLSRRRIQAPARGCYDLLATSNTCTWLYLVNNVKNTNTTHEKKNPKIAQAKICREKILDFYDLIQSLRDGPSPRIITATDLSFWVLIFNEEIVV